MPEHPILKLGKYGTTGVILGSFIVIMFFGGIIYKIATNHMSHSDAIIERNTEAWVNNTEVMSGLKTVIEIKLK